MSTLQTQMAAAAAAVQAYLEEEQAQIDAQIEAQRQASLQAAAQSFGPPPWAMAGRQEIMTLRRLIQLKAF